MVLAELACGIAQGFERLRDCDVARLKPHLRARNSDFRLPGAFRRLPGDKRRPIRGAAVLGVVVGEHHPFTGDAIDVRRLVAHHTKRKALRLVWPTSSPMMMRMFGRPLAAGWPGAGAGIGC